MALYQCRNFEHTASKTLSRTFMMLGAQLCLRMHPKRTCALELPRSLKFEQCYKCAIASVKIGNPIDLPSSFS